MHVTSGNACRRDRHVRAARQDRGTSSWRGGPSLHATVPVSCSLSCRNPAARQNHAVCRLILPTKSFHKNGLNWICVLISGSKTAVSGEAAAAAKASSLINNGERSPRRACQALRSWNHFGLQEVEVEPVSKYVTDSDRRSEHQGGSGMVPWEANGVHLQSQSEEKWVSLSLYLG
ncbi:hypothetical protein V6N13_015188 [Hibiscus sabdariffa]